MRTTMQLERHEASLRSLAETGARPHPIPATTREALGWATMDGARMAHLDGSVGSLTPGKQADITLVRKTDLNLVGAADPVNAIVMHANPGNVDTVFIAGRPVKQGGKLDFGNLATRIAELEVSSARILETFRDKTSADDLPPT